MQTLITLTIPCYQMISPSISPFNHFNCPYYHPPLILTMQYTPFFSLNSCNLVAIHHSSSHPLAHYGLVITLLLFTLFLPTFLPNLYAGVHLSTIHYIHPYALLNFYSSLQLIFINTSPPCLNFCSPFSVFASLLHL